MGRVVFRGQDAMTEAMDYLARRTRLDWQAISTMLDRLAGAVLERGVYEMQEAMTRADLKFTGHLIGSVPASSHTRISGAGDRTAHVIANRPYALVMDEGRRPGARRPPLKPLALWAKRKLGVGGGKPGKPRKKAAGRKPVKKKVAMSEAAKLKRAKKRVLVDKEAMRVAYVLARSIAKKGIKGRQFSRTTELKVARVIGPMAWREVERYLSERGYS